jgi:hypothetical protein
MLRLHPGHRRPDLLARSRGRRRRRHPTSEMLLAVLPAAQPKYKKLDLRYRRYLDICLDQKQ